MDAEFASFGSERGGEEGLFSMSKELMVTPMNCRCSAAEMRWPLRGLKGLGLIGAISRNVMVSSPTHRGTTCNVVCSRVRGRLGSP